MFLVFIFCLSGSIIFILIRINIFFTTYEKKLTLSNWTSLYLLWLHGLKLLLRLILFKMEYRMYEDEELSFIQTCSSRQ